MGFKFKSNFSGREAFFGLGGIAMLLTGILIMIGIASIYSASYSVRSGILLPYAKKQLMWLLFSLAVCAGIVAVDYRWLLKNAFWIYAIGVAFLLVTAVIGTARGGSRRWIKIGPLLLQTSEIMKLAIIIALARMLSKQQRTGSIMDLMLPFGVTLLPMLLIVLQPDLGTSLVFIPILLVMVFASGVPIKHLVLVILIAVNLSLPLYHFGLHDYQRKRVQMFLFQSNMTREEKQGSGYHLVQSKIAHGNGGTLGRGWRHGTQNRYGYLPERHTDFIFAVIGEERGFTGTTVVLLLYASLYFTMLVMAYTTPVPSMQLMILGITALLTTQTIVNTCMTVGMAPITGLPLPFLSYGGSALLFNLAALALVISIAGRKDAVRSD